MRVFMVVAVLATALSASAGGQRQGCETAEPCSALLTKHRDARVAAPAATHVSVLDAFLARTLRQTERLAGFRAKAVFRAHLVSRSQNAELGVVMHYLAPRILEFTQTHSAGDSFVKRNVIIRLLQAEVDRVAKPPHNLAISSMNYTFSHKGSDVVNNRPVEVYAVKPRRKIVGLFKGRIYLDAFTGSLVRISGTMVKSPSFFIRSIEFTQDYADFDEFTVPARLRSAIDTRIVGKVEIEVSTDDYALLVRDGIGTAAIVPDRQQR